MLIMAPVEGQNVRNAIIFFFIVYCDVISTIFAFFQLHRFPKQQIVKIKQMYSISYVLYVYMQTCKLFLSVQHVTYM